MEKSIMHNFKIGDQVSITLKTGEHFDSCVINSFDDSMFNVTIFNIANDNEQTDESFDCYEIKTIELL